MHFEPDVAPTAHDPRPAKSPQQPEVRNLLLRQGEFANRARVGADVEVADGVHDPLAGQGMVGRVVGEAEAEAVATVRRRQAAALGVRGFRRSEELGVAGGEEVRVDDVADFRRQLGEARSESPVQIDRRRLCDVQGLAWRG